MEWVQSIGRDREGEKFDELVLVERERVLARIFNPLAGESTFEAHVWGQEAEFFSVEAAKEWVEGELTTRRWEALRRRREEIQSTNRWKREAARRAK